MGILRVCLIGTLAVLAVVQVHGAAVRDAAAQTHPEQVVLVDKLMAMMSLDQVMAQVAGATTESIVAEVRRVNPRMTDADANTVYKLFYDAMMGMSEESIALSRKIFLRHYTAEDLKVMIAFYETPTGRKSIELMPQIIQEVTVATQDMLGRRIPPIVEALKKRLEAAGYQIPA